LLEPLEQT